MQSWSFAPLSTTHIVPITEQNPTNCITDASTLSRLCSSPTVVWHTERYANSGFFKLHVGLWSVHCAEQTWTQIAVPDLRDHGMQGGLICSCQALQWAWKYEILLYLCMWMWWGCWHTDQWCPVAHPPKWVRSRQQLWLDRWWWNISIQFQNSMDRTVWHEWGH